VGLFSNAGQRYETKLEDERLYNMVAQELADGHVSQGLYAKAIAEADGDKGKVEARYIQLRADLLRSEMAAEFEAKKQREQIAANQALRDMTEKDNIANAIAIRQAEAEKANQRALAQAQYKARINEPVKWPPQLDSYFHPLIWMGFGCFVIGREVFSPPLQIPMVIAGVGLILIGLWLTRGVVKKK
jgi:hypothetical protein